MIWYDLVDTKFGDEYLVLYISRQCAVKKWFKILTIVFSASGIFTTFKDFKIPTLISLFAIGVVQTVSLIEGFIIHSEKDIESLIKLRLMYYDKLVIMESLLHSLDTQEITETEASAKLFIIRASSREIEELDTQMNIRQHGTLINKCNIITNGYLKKYHHE